MKEGITLIIYYVDSNQKRKILPEVRRRQREEINALWARVIFIFVGVLVCYGLFNTQWALLKVLLGMESAEKLIAPVLLIAIPLVVIFCSIWLLKPFPPKVQNEKVTLYDDYIEHTCETKKEIIIYTIRFDDIASCGSIDSAIIIRATKMKTKRKNKKTLSSNEIAEPKTAGGAQRAIHIINRYFENEDEMYSIICAEHKKCSEKYRKEYKLRHPDPLI